MKLDAEEKEILEAYEAGKLKKAPNAKTEIRRLRKAAAATLAKDARINIRLPTRTLIELQKIAMDEGLPYQTLISSVLHKFAQGRLVSAMPARPPRR